MTQNILALKKYIIDRWKKRITKNNPTDMTHFAKDVIEIRRKEGLAKHQNPKLSAGRPSGHDFSRVILVVRVLVGANVSDIVVVL